MKFYPSLELFILDAAVAQRVAALDFVDPILSLMLFICGTFLMLTDTGDDSKLVQRRIWSNVCRAPPRYLLVEFPTRPSDEYDSAPSRKYTAHFVPCSPVSVNNLSTR